MVETDRFESLRHFNDTRTRLVEAADALAKLAEKRRDTGLSLRAWALSRKLDNASFRVVLAGGQKRGKSTLINSLLGTRLLPAGVIPVTSVVTTIAYSERPCARVLLAGGEVEEVSISRFPDYVADRDGATGAISVEVMYPSTFLRHGVTLVDTPHTESGENGDAQTLGRVAEGADLLLLLLSADQPVSHAELDLLGDNILFLKEGDRLVSASSTPSAGVGLLPLILPTRFAKRIARLALRRAATDTIKVAVEIGQSFRREVENESQSFIRDFRERVRLNVGKIVDALVRCEGMQHAGPVERGARLQLLAKDAAKLETIQELAGS